MYPEMISDSELWLELFQKWDKLRVDVPDQLEKALNDIKAFCEDINAYGVGTLAPPYTLNDVYDFAEHTNALWSFTNSIHSEVEELIDLPFATAAGNILQEAYALNPSGITVTHEFPVDGVPPVQLSLTDIFVVALVDAQLKLSLSGYTYALGNDTINAKPELAEILKEAAFWQGEHDKAKEIEATADEVFPPDVRDSWPNMTKEERDAIAQVFVREIGIVLGGPNGPVVTGIEWKDRTAAPYSGTVVEVDQGFFLYRDGVKSNVERLIDAVVHESYHMRQYLVRTNPKAYGAPQSVADAWNEPYIENGKPHPTIPNHKASSKEYFEQPLEYDTRAFAALCS